MIGKNRSILKQTHLALTELIQESVSFPIKWSLSILNHTSQCFHNVYSVITNVKIQIECIIFISKYMITIYWMFAALYNIYNLYKFTHIKRKNWISIAGKIWSTYILTLPLNSTKCFWKCIIITKLFINMFGTLNKWYLYKHIWNRTYTNIIKFSSFYYIYKDCG